jgi:nucleoside-diphosphate-sugar epimerase
MRVLVTGTDGYIGSVMTPYLAERGHEVVGLDTGFYRAGWLFDDRRSRPATITKDIRDITPEDLRGFDAVVHLAELSNDPLGEHNVEITYDINFRGSMNVAQAAKAAGVKRFVYASSCSIYGVGSNDARTEESEPNPQTAYAECKVRCEKGMRELADESFAPTFMRNATAFGASPRMRFDIVLNNLAGLARTTKKIEMTSDGTPWRPLVHILDICQSVDLALRAPADKVRAESFNVGDDAQNYRVREIAEIVAAAFPGCQITFGAASADNRSYRVSFAKIRKHLPDFKCQWTAERGAFQLARVFERIEMAPSVFNAPPFTRLLELKRLLNSGQLDDRFNWTQFDLESDRPPSRQAAE